MELKKLLNSKVGDIITLSNFEALEECGGSVDLIIAEVHSYTHPESSLEYTMFEVQYEDLEICILVKVIGESYDIRRFTKYADCSFEEFIDNIPNNHDETGGLPTGFLLDPDGSDEDCEYQADDPFPIYGFQKDGRILCAIGEYTTTAEFDITYWAPYCFMEWYISEDEDSDDLDNYHSLWFGANVNIADLNVLQGC